MDWIQGGVKRIVTFVWLPLVNVFRTGAIPAIGLPVETGGSMRGSLKIRVLTGSDR